MTADFSSDTLAEVEVNDSLILYPPELAQTPVAREDVVMNAIAQTALAQIVSSGLQLPDRIIIGRFSQSDYEQFKTQGTYGIALWALPVSQQINTSRPAWRSERPEAPPLTATISSDTITLAGEVVEGINVVLLGGSPQGSISLTTSVVDTLDTVAANIAVALVQAGVAASATGPVITVSKARIRMSLPGKKWREASRIQQHVQITVWAGVKELQSLIGDALLSAVGTISAPRIPIDSRSTAWVRYVGSRRADDDEQDSLWSYNLIVSAQYAIIETQVAYAVLSPSVDFRVGSGPHKIVNI